MNSAAEIQKPSMARILRVPFDDNALTGLGTVDIESMT
jgi:hypothetical protein